MNNTTTNNTENVTEYAVSLSENELYNNWFKDMISKEIEEIKGAISNERIWEKSEYDEINNLHSYNISILERYIKMLEDVNNKSLTKIQSLINCKKLDHIVVSDSNINISTSPQYTGTETIVNFPNINISNTD